MKKSFEESVNKNLMGMNGDITKRSVTFQNLT